MKLRGSGTFTQALKRTRQLAKKHDAPMKGYMLLLFIYAGATILLPLITVNVIDALVQADDFRQFLLLALLFFFANITKAIFRAVINIYTTRREFQYGKDLEWILMDCFFKKKGEFYIKNTTGDMMEVIMEDTLQVAVFTYQVYRTIADLVNSIAILAVLAYLQWDLVLILLACFPFILIIQNNLEWKLDDWYDKFRAEMARENSLSEEFISNAALIAAHGIKEKCRRKYRQMLMQLSMMYKKIVTYSNLSFGSLECFIILSISIAIIYEGYKIFMGTATIGVLVAFIQYSDFLIDPGRLVAALRVQGNKLMPSLKRFDKIYFDSQTDKGGDKPDFKKFDIEFNDVGFCYPTGKRVFKNAQVKMESNKTHVIVGASGQGKTTMIHLITGLWDATEGSLSIGGYPVETINLDYLRKHISLVSQDDLFFNESIRDNLMEEENQYTEEELYTALRKAGMLDEVLEMPHKLDTELGDRGYSLSGGQRQRLAITRALLKDAPVIIFDEPTSALDEGTERVILNTIKELSGKTILVITHRKSLMDIGDCIYEINNQNIRPISM
ncbi:ABC transporter ATP-binding protein [Emergencia sp.]|uniref:ABC transporter ATP-binding protein n=1 Tax=Emergencia sp. TaxID=1926557 RepID=UPI003AEFC224